MHPCKRTAALAAAAAAIAALAACSSTTAAPSADPAPAPSSTAVVASTPPPTADPTAGDPTAAEFIDRFGPMRDSSGDIIWLSPDEVEDEFHAAAAAFPLALPERYTWPTELSRSLGTVTEFERGTGVAEAYLYWEAAHATAAYADHFNGDAAAATAHLEQLVEGYASPVRSMSVDPEQPGTDSDYYRAVLEPALNGDFDALTHAQISAFVTNAEYQAIAIHAGDVINVGTEGFSRSIEDQPGDPGYIEDVRVELAQRIADAR